MGSVTDVLPRGVVQGAVGRLVQSNNERIRRIGGPSANPRPLAGVAWHRRLVDAHPIIAGEWDRYVADGGGLPLIEQLIDEHQGNEGPWHAGLLVSDGKPRAPLADLFPGTIRVLRTIPGLRAALWSVFPGGTELPEHRGSNAGVLRYHLGVRCVDGAALRVEDAVVPYREAEGVLFDDTAPHAAWNRGGTDRVTLFLELLRPLPPVTAAANRAVQRVIALDHRYREAPRRSREWHGRSSPAPTDLPGTGR